MRRIRVLMRAVVLLAVGVARAIAQEAETTSSDGGTVTGTNPQPLLRDWEPRGVVRCTVDGLTKVWSGSGDVCATGTPATSPAVVEAAQNEFESFQIVVGATIANATVTAVASDLTIAPGTPVPPGMVGTISSGANGHVRLYREDLIDITGRSGIDGATGQWPDALIPDYDSVYNEARTAFPTPVTNSRDSAIYVEVHVPPNAAPGTYAGTVTLVFTDMNVRTVGVSLTVWNFAVPSISSLRTFYKVTHTNICSLHGTSCPDRELNDAYAALLLDHRLSGQPNRLTNLNAGREPDVNYNWSTSFDNYYAALVEGNYGRTLLAVPKLTSFVYSVTDARAVTDFSAWKTHFDSPPTAGLGAPGILFDFTCDEPCAVASKSCSCTYSQAAANAANPLAAGVPTLVTTGIDGANAIGTSNITYLAPNVNRVYDFKHGDQRNLYNYWFDPANPSAQGDRRLWWYQSCNTHGCSSDVAPTYTLAQCYSDNGNVNKCDVTGWPQYVIDVGGVQNRAMQWLTFLENIQGEHYYEIVAAYFLEDITQFNSPWYSQLYKGGNGDGSLVYPGIPAGLILSNGRGTIPAVGGVHHVPLPSLRLKMIRDGMEDYEYLHILASAGDTYGRCIAGKLFPQPNGLTAPNGSGGTSPTVTPAQLLRARRNLALRILANKGEPGVPAPDPCP